MKNMLTSIRSWNDTFFKACPSPGYHPFFLNKRCEPRYPLKWSVPIRSDGWDFESLSNEDQNVVAQLLAVAPLDAQVLISMIMLLFFFHDLIVYVDIAGNLVDNEPFEIPTWKMDPKRFKEARAYALTKRKSLALPATQIEVGATSGPSTAIERPSSYSASPQGKKALSKKRKEPSAATTVPSFKGEDAAAPLLPTFLLQVPFLPLRK